MENLNLLTVAVSSSALFDLTESDSIYQHEGLEAYRRYQIEHEEQVLEPGEGFLLVKKLLSLNDQLGEIRSQSQMGDCFERASRMNAYFAFVGSKRFVHVLGEPF